MSNATVGELTIDSAPRDQDKLANVGRYQLRRLATSLGILESDERKSAFMGGTPVTMAQAVAEALKLYDKQRGVNGHANGQNGVAAPIATLPIEEPVAPPAQVEAAKPAEEPAREPRTRKTQAVKEAAKEAAAPAPSADNTELVQAMKGMRQEIQDLGKLLTPKKAEPDTRIDQLTTVVIGLAEQQKFLFSLLMMLAENSPQINASRGDILSTVVEDSEGVAEDLQYQIKKRVQGKD